MIYSFALCCLTSLFHFAHLSLNLPISSLIASLFASTKPQFIDNWDLIWCLIRAQRLYLYLGNSSMARDSRAHFLRPKRPLNWSMVLATDHCQPCLNLKTYTNLIVLIFLGKPYRPYCQPHITIFSRTPFLFPFNKDLKFICLGRSWKVFLDFDGSRMWYICPYKSIKGPSAMLKNGREGLISFKYIPYLKSRIRSFQLHMNPCGPGNWTTYSQLLWVLVGWSGQVLALLRGFVMPSWGNIRDVLFFAECPSWTYCCCKIPIRELLLLQNICSPKHFVESSTTVIFCN